jgi:hypothetical protein
MASSNNSWKVIFRIVPSSSSAAHVSGSSIWTRLPGITCQAHGQRHQNRADFLHGCFQFVFGNTELFGPILEFVYTSPLFVALDIGT